MVPQSLRSSAQMKIKTFETLSGAAFMKMEPQEIAALSRDELVRLALRVRAIMAAIATHMRAIETTEIVNFDFDIKCVADFESMKPQGIAALSKEELVTLALRGQGILQRCPIKPGCRFCSLPDEYYLHVLLEWLTIEDQARFDMALLNRMDRRAHMHLLRDTEHGGVLSVSGGRMDAYGNTIGYTFDSGVCAWLESRNVFMRALKFQDYGRDIPDGFLARTGRQLLQLDLSQCCSISDAELGKLAARCPRLEEMTLSGCFCITDAALECVAQHCSRLHALVVSYTKITGGGLARLDGSCRNMKRLDLSGMAVSVGLSAISDAELGRIAEMWPNLEDLDLSGCRDITYVGLSGLAQHCKHIHMVDLCGTQVTGDGIARLGGSWRNIKKLHLHGLAVSDAGLGRIAKMCPNLRDVDLGSCTRITDIGLASLARHCQLIHTLDLSSCAQFTGEGLESLGDGLRNLRKIFLGEAAISDAGLGKIAEMCPGLEEVDLGECRSISDVGISSLAKHCQHIHTLYLCGAQITAGEGLAGLEKGWRKMKKLDLSHSDISDAGLGKFADMCPNLEDVDLGSCGSLTDVGLSSLVRRCPRLHTLKLTLTKFTGGGLARHGDGWRHMKNLHLFCSDISDTGLGKIAEMCPNLENVSLSGCRSITDEGALSLAQHCSRLHALCLCSTQVTDVGATNLARLCPKLRLLQLSGSKGTAEGVASLREAYPALSISFRLVEN